MRPYVYSEIIKKSTDPKDYRLLMAFSAKERGTHRDPLKHHPKEGSRMGTALAGAGMGRPV